MQGLDQVTTGTVTGRGPGIPDEAERVDSETGAIAIADSDRDRGEELRDERREIRDDRERDSEMEAER